MQIKTANSACVRRTFPSLALDTDAVGRVFTINRVWHSAHRCKNAGNVVFSGAISPNEEGTRYVRSVQCFDLIEENRFHKRHLAIYDSRQMDVMQIIKPWLSNKLPINVCVLAMQQSNGAFVGCRTFKLLQTISIMTVIAKVIVLLRLQCITILIAGQLCGNLFNAFAI